MDNQDNQNCPINQMPNALFFSPYKESPYKNLPQGKDFKHLYQLSPPYRSNIGISFTPSKKNDFGNVYCTSLGETPIPLNVNSSFSPLPVNRIDISNQKTQYQQRAQAFTESSPFKPFPSPNNQRISDRK
jgi:hypothetical protein